MPRPPLLPITGTIGALRHRLSDPRFRDDQKILIRIVDNEQTDEEHYGAYYAVEVPISGGLTGWVDGHVTLLVEAKLANMEKPKGEVNGSNNGGPS